MKNIIKFYTTKGPLPWATNFSVHPVIIDGRVWRTNEHYYQAMKFNGEELIELSRDILAEFEHILRPIDVIPSLSKNVFIPLQEFIRIQSGPKMSATWGRNKNFPLRSDWEFVKEAFMYKGLKAKFSQHPIIAKELIETGDAILVEDSPIDFYWGCGKDGTGKNRLGVLLMRLRDELVSLRN